jgi:hypothetical protein
LTREMISYRFAAAITSGGPLKPSSTTRCKLPATFE